MCDLERTAGRQFAGFPRAGGFISEFEDRFPQEESGNFGFDMEWGVTGTNAFDIGTYTVTAP